MRKPNQRNLRPNELKIFLPARNYSEKLLDSSINRARKIPRKAALFKVQKKEEINRPVFAVKYDPRLQLGSDIHCPMEIIVKMSDCLGFKDEECHNVFEKRTIFKNVILGFFRHTNQYIKKVIKKNIYIARFYIHKGVQLVYKGKFALFHP